MPVICSHSRVIVASGGRIFPTGYTDSLLAAATNPTYGYDSPQCNESPVTLAGQTTAAYMDSTESSTGGSFSYNFGNITSKALHLVFSSDFADNAVAVPGAYLDCGAGPYLAGRTQHGAGSMSIQVYNGTTLLSAVVSGSGVTAVKAKQDLLLGTFSGTDVKVQITLVGSDPLDIYVDPGCANTYVGTVSGSTNLSAYLCYGV